MSSPQDYAHLPEAAPRLMVIAGANGSGKTTLTNLLREHGNDLAEYLNADEIALGLTGEVHERNLAAMHLSEQRRAALLAARESFSLETVMSHTGKLDLMREAKAKGYYVILVFVALEDPILNIERGAQRVSQGGHDVPTEKIVERYLRVMQYLPEAIRLADYAVLYDNSSLCHRLVAVFEQGIVQALADAPPGWLKRYVIKPLKIRRNRLWVRL